MFRRSISPLSRGSLPGPRRALATAAVAVAALWSLTSTVAAADTPPTASKGCGVPAPVAGSSSQQLTSANGAGHYMLDVPAAADRPTPLVIDLHGYTETAEIHHASSGLGDFGRANGFLTVTPQLDEPGVPRWDFAPGSKDVGYLTDLLDHVESTLCVDQRRVYLSGLSMGAFTASSLACQWSDRIAAIAPVAGLQDFTWCHTSRPVPVVAFHGTGDPIVAYTGGPGPNAALLPAPDGGTARAPGGGPAVAGGPGPQSVPDDAAAWARRNGCGATPTLSHVTPDVDLTSYPCPAAGNVDLYSVLGGGHTWPGSTFPGLEPFTGRTTTSINADRIIWDFFRAHPLPH